MAEHSELPWFASSEAINSISIFDAKSQEVAASVCDDQLSPEMEANASYIVRACNSFPELVKALEITIDALENAEPSESFSYLPAIESARAALSRARE